MITRASGWSFNNTWDIPTFHIATRAIPDARGSLRGYGQNSLVNVHLEIGLGASDFGVKGELRLVDALGVHIFEPPWLWTAQPNCSDSEIRFGRLRRRPLRGRIATSEGWWQWHGCPSGEWNITWLLLTCGGIEVEANYCYAILVLEWGMCWSDSMFHPLPHPDQLKCIGRSCCWGRLLCRVRHSVSWHCTSPMMLHAF